MGLHLLAAFNSLGAMSPASPVRGGLTAVALPRPVLPAVVTLGCEGGTLELRLVGLVGAASDMMVLAALAEETFLCCRAGGTEGGPIES